MWAVNEFSLKEVDFQKFCMNGAALCALGKECFLELAPDFVGDILWEHLEILQKGQSWRVPVNNSQHPGQPGPGAFHRPGGVHLELQSQEKHLPKPRFQMGIPTAAGKANAGSASKRQSVCASCLAGIPSGQGHCDCLESMVGFSKAFFLSLFSSCCEFYYFLHWNWVQEYSQNPAQISQWQLEAALLCSMSQKRVFHVPKANISGRRRHLCHSLHDSTQGH